MAGKNPKSTSAQSKEFIQAARELGCDENEVLLDQRRRKLRTVEIIRGELAAAETELTEWQDRFDRYTGNNPNKYQSDIRSAALTVSRLKDELAFAERGASPQPAKRSKTEPAE